MFYIVLSNKALKLASVSPLGYHNEELAAFVVLRDHMPRSRAHESRHRILTALPSRCGGHVDSWLSLAPVKNSTLETWELSFAVPAGSGNLATC